MRARGPRTRRQRAVIASDYLMFTRDSAQDLSLRYVNGQGRSVRDLAVCVLSCPDSAAFSAMSGRDKKRCWRESHGGPPNGHPVTFPLSPLYGLARVYSVVSGASTTRTSLDMEVDCMPIRHRSARRRRRPKDQAVGVAVPVAIPVATAVAAGDTAAVDGAVTDRKPVATFKEGGRPLPLAA